MTLYQTYNESLLVPYVLLGVLIKEVEYGNTGIPLNRIGILKNDKESIRNFDSSYKYELYDYEDGAYRCYGCGNIIDSKGAELYDSERQRIIDYIQFSDFPIVKTIMGDCCKDKYFH